MAISTLSLARGGKSRILTMGVILLVSSALYYSLHHPPQFLHQVDKYRQRLKGDRGVFLEKVLADDVGGKYDGQGLREMCDKQTWQKGLYFTCDDLTGGIGNVRNTFLNCFRFALEAGGMHMVVAMILIIC